MASISKDQNNLIRIQFVAPDRKRKSIRLGRIGIRLASAIKLRVEQLLASRITGIPISREMATWLTGDGLHLRSKLEKAGLVDPLRPTSNLTLTEYLDQFVQRNGVGKKPATIIVWMQVVKMLNRYMPAGIKLNEVTRGHAKHFLKSLRLCGTLSPTTIHKRIGFARQFFTDAVDWGLISDNPFTSVKTSASSGIVNSFVDRKTIEKILAVCDTDWQIIVALSRYGGLRCPSEVLSLRWADIDWGNLRMNVPEPKVEHHDGRGMRCVPIFPELMPYLLAAKNAARPGATFVVSKDSYRRAALRPGGWANANLRSQFLKRLKSAGVAPWKRLFHSLRASRQTELAGTFERHVVCAWMGNSAQVAQRSYLMVTEGHFELATGSAGGAECGAVEPQDGAQIGAAPASRASQGHEKNLGKTAPTADSPGLMNLLQVEDNGLEPMTYALPARRSPN